MLERSRGLLVLALLLPWAAQAQDGHEGNADVDMETLHATSFRSRLPGVQTAGDEHAIPPQQFSVRKPMRAFIAA